MILSLLALALAIDTPPSTDPVRAAIQQILYDVQDGKDFTQGSFKAAVTPETAKQLATMKDCRLDGVTRTKGDAMALVHWDCEDAKLGKPSMMVRFDSGVVKSIELVAYVSVPVQGRQ